jgi:hypothetical protein
MVKLDTKMRIWADKIQKTMRFSLGYFRSILILTSRPVPRDLSMHLKLSPNANHVFYMTINCSLQDYIRTYLLHLGTFFYSLFSFYPWGWPRCVSTIFDILFLPCHELWSTCKYVIFFISRLDSLYLALIWKNINNDTLNTFRVRCYNDRSMRLQISL